MTNDLILSQQIAYYRARAAEYDQWFYRQGRYDHGEALNQRWHAQAAEVRAQVHALPACDSALEFAPGTGIWTQELIRFARHVTAVDASAEMIALNRAKLGDRPNITYVQHDIFNWEPPAQYDLVFFSFWFSHVPPERVPAFLSMVRRALKPEGTLFLIDSRPDPTSSARDNGLRPDEHIVRTRILNDGSSYQIIKVYYEPAELNAVLQTAGFEAQVHTTDHYFIYAQGRQRQESAT